MAIWKSHFSDKIKREFFQTIAVFVLLYGCSTWNETPGVKVRLELPKDTAGYFEQILEATPYKAATVQPLTPYLTSCLSVSKTYWRSKDKLLYNILLFDILLHVDTAVLADLQKLIYISSMQTLGAI